MNYSQMKKIITPAEAGRQMEYDYWMKSKMPMAHIGTTLDVTRIIRFCKKNKEVPLNAAMCYCIGQAVNKIKEGHLLIEGENMIWSDVVNVQTIVKDKNGSLRFCDLPTVDSFTQYVDNYRRIVKEVYDSCSHHFLDDRIFIGTSCLSTRLPIDIAVNQWNDSFQNLFLMWGAYKRHFFRKYELTMILQFHHVQINGGEVCHFFETLQDEFNKIQNIL